MPELNDIEAKLPLLSLAEQIALRDQLDERIDSMMDLSAAHAERMQIEEIEKRLDAYLAGGIPAEPWEVAEKRIREELGL